MITERERDGAPSTQGSLVGSATLLVRHWRLLVGLPLVFAVIAVTWTFFTRQYLTRSTFRPENTGQLGQFASLAAQFGVSLGPVTDASLPLDFYRKVIRSRPILFDVARTTYVVHSASGDSTRGTYLDLYHVTGPTENIRLNKAFNRLFKNVTVDLDRPAGTVEIQVVAKWPDLAVQINQRILDLINEFNVSKRNSSAASRRDFALERMKEAKDSLDDIDNTLRVFLERNRRYQQSPELLLEFARLQRVVALKQQVYGTLATAYEQARVDAVKDVPVLTVIESPGLSVSRSGGLGSSAFLGGLFGLIVAAGTVFLMEYLQFERRNRPELYEELDRLTLPLRRIVRGQPR
jgi:uncharacterized protein involved in exopolysaccharide biosynthesis